MKSLIHNLNTFQSERAGLGNAPSQKRARSQRPRKVIWGIYTINQPSGRDYFFIPSLLNSLQFILLVPIPQIDTLIFFEALRLNKTYLIFPNPHRDTVYFQAIYSCVFEPITFFCILGEGLELLGPAIHRVFLLPDFMTTPIFLSTFFSYGVVTIHHTVQHLYWTQKSNNA